MKRTNGSQVVLDLTASAPDPASQQFPTTIEALRNTSSEQLVIEMLAASEAQLLETNRHLVDLLAEVTVENVLLRRVFDETITRLQQRFKTRPVE